MSRKPCVHMIRNGERLPFDVAPNRTIFFDFDIEEANRAKEELEAMIIGGVTDPHAAPTPLSLAIDLAPPGESKNPVEAGVAEILELVQDMHAIVGGLQGARLELVAAKLSREYMESLGEALKTRPLEPDTNPPKGD